ncbi:MAG: hypothetical protein M9927_23375 [Anaerolineae bacterium]|nr:hypothetical protein [Anaerolineae bacterium]
MAIKPNQKGLTCKFKSISTPARLAATRSSWKAAPHLLAGGAVTLSCGDAVLLATGYRLEVGARGNRFLPLSVDFEEKMYAAGRIPGSLFSVAGQASEQAILTARSDRPVAAPAL